MKIAVIDHIGNYGGGSRVVRSLLPALKLLDPDLEITYFGNPTAIRREKNGDGIFCDRYCCARAEIIAS